jgi:hypothetical protein
MRSHFKKFKEYLNEEDSDDTCPRCGEDWNKCSCIDNDYYDAKVHHYAPSGELKKGPHKSQEDNG